MGLGRRRLRADREPGIVAALLGICIVAGCATPPPHAKELSRIFLLRDRREAGIGDLVRLLAFPDAQVRKQAALALGAVGGPTHIDALTRPAAEDPDPSVRAAAAFALGQLPGPDRGQTLARLTLADDTQVRRAVVASVRRQDVGCWQQLVHLLSDEDASVRGQVALALLRVCGGRRRGANTRLSQQRRQMTATILRSALNQETEPEAHWRIVYALSHLGPAPGDPPAASATVLLAVAGNRHFGRWSRLFAIRGLRWLPADSRIRAGLLTLLKDPDWALVYESMTALPAPDPRLVTQGQNAQNPRPRYHGVGVGTELILLRGHRHPLVRERATLLLGGYTDLKDEVVAILRGHKNAAAHMRAAAVQALTRLLRIAALPDIDRAIQDASPWVRIGAARALRFLPDTVAVPRLRRLLADHDVRVGTAALQTLARFRHSDLALALAMEATRVRELALRETVGNTLLGIGDPKAIGALIAAYKDSPGLAFAEARRLLVAAVGSLGGAQRQASAFLLAAARDQHGMVRRQAARQLRALGRAVPDTTAQDQAEKAQWLTPRLGTDIRWSLLDQRPRLHCRTERGSFVVELYPDHAPIHCHNLMKLVETGAYRDRIFHRVVPNFVVQGGDARGDGFGANPFFGGQLRDEINPVLFDAGVVGMPKNADPNTGGDQIFITTVPTPHLDRRYTVFGRVVRGMDVVERIEIGDRLLSISIWRVSE